MSRPALQDNLTIIVNVGQRVRFTRSHPWAGATGHIVDFSDTPWGRKPIVQMEEGDVRCFIMKPTDFVAIRRR